MADQREIFPPMENRGAVGGAKRLTPQAQRALDEAAQRRLTREHAEDRPREINGRAGLDPVRYGDWENKGIASDF